MKLYEWARNMADINPSEISAEILAVELYYETNHRQ
jgi:hypothetical protein